MTSEAFRLGKLLGAFELATLKMAQDIAAGKQAVLRTYARRQLKSRDDAMTNEEFLAGVAARERAIARRTLHAQVRKARADLGLPDDRGGA